MSGASFKMDTSGFMRGMSGAINHFADMQVLSAAIGEAQVSSTRQRFKDEEDPDGNAWEKSRRAEEEGGKTLTNKIGRIKNSIGYEATPDEVVWGSNFIGGGIHQFGGEIKPKKGKFLKFPGSGGQPVFAKKVVMPARPYLGFNDEDREEAKEMIAVYMAEGFKR